MNLFVIILKLTTPLHINSVQSTQSNSCFLGRVTEYSVYLAVRNTHGRETHLSFARVYVGANPFCIVSLANLHTAHIDRSSKPAIIFRIAARNEKVNFFANM